MPYQPIPPPFGHPFMKMPNHQNLSALPVSCNELEIFFRALKAENNELRKEPTPRQSNRVDNSTVDKEISVSSQEAKHPILPLYPPTAKFNIPVLSISSLRTQKLSSHTFSQTKQPKLVVSVSSEKPWTVVGSLSAKSKKTQGSNSFPTPLKAPRPERERRKGLPAYMRFLKLGYNSAGNLTSLVSENATANTMLANYGDLLLKKVLELDKDIKELVEDLEWIPLKKHLVEIRGITVSKKMDSSSYAVSYWLGHQN
ncbi:hypothetical protein HI914_06192 [Erysiphe necator]|nr:hypothetical protein HI914_06192 [Erysiphe necator]